MPDLIAQGPQPHDRWRRKLPTAIAKVIGRTAGAWSTPWDEHISRQHVEVTYREGRLHVVTLPEARNPVYFRGHKCDNCSLRPGDHFVIGHTTFSLVDEHAQVAVDAVRPAREQTFTIEELRRTPFRRPDQRIEVLSRLPQVISNSSNDQELFLQLVNLLLSGVQQASAAAVVAVNQEAVSVLHWDRRASGGGDFRPSEGLIRQAVESGESVAYVWGASPEQTARNFTMSEGLDWAFCVPVGGKASAGWALYIAGSFGPQSSVAAPFVATTPEIGSLPTTDALRDDIKFTELAAATLSALRESRLLARRQAGLSQFFSPVVLEALSSQDPDVVFQPREADVTVLFCDLRGFTRESERSAGNLFGLLGRVSQALGVMTRHILDQGGVVGDFHGDAAMGFWGWPLPQPDAVERACRAALAIQSAFKDCEDSELRDFCVGIGIASGRAVAGKIGTPDQVKVTVFGPVVNLASRLETMTRQTGAAILIDPPTAAVLKSTLPAGIARVRRLAKVRPAGLSAPLEVSELLPPLPLPLGEGRGEGFFSETHLTTYESALQAFEEGNWPQALKHLHQVPPEDQAKDFLTVFIAQHNRTPPPGWDGAIPLEGK